MHPGREGSLLMNRAMLPYYVDKKLDKYSPFLPVVAYYLHNFLQTLNTISLLDWEKNIVYQKRGFPKAFESFHPCKLSNSK